MAILGNQVSMAGQSCRIEIDELNIVITTKNENILEGKG